jgi:hypothetical protein
MPWVFSFAGTAMQLVCEDNAYEASIGEETHQLFTDPVIATKTIFGEEVYIRTDQIAYMQKVSQEAWEKVQAKREALRKRTGEDIQILEVPFPIIPK